MLGSTTRPAPAHDGPLAPYARVKQHLRDGLRQGHWSPGERMPSEAELVAQFGVSRMTVNRALRELAAEGLVERVQGLGTFAKALYPLASRLHIRDLRDEITGRGHRHHASVHLRQRERAGAGLAAQLGLPTGASVFHTRVVHHEDGVPLQAEDRYVNPAAAPGYLDVDFEAITPTRYLLTVAPLWEASYSIEAGTATADEAALLRIDPAEPCLILVRRTSSRGLPVTIARLVHPGRLHRLQGEFSP